jgi:predicted transcriptional regulator of viral defense system
MNYLEFRNQFFELGCVNTHQIYTWNKNFEKNNLTNWVKQKLLIKLRNGYYAFPEYLNSKDFAYYISNKIYRPSYISCHSVLAFYDIIPEAVVQITAVSSLKTATFENAFGTFSYNKISSNLFFGYIAKEFSKSRAFLFATPEKALLDLLYLYPFYNTASELEGLRLDEDFLHKNFKLEFYQEYLEKFQSRALSKRAELLLKVYDLC